VKGGLKFLWFDNFVILSKVLKNQTGGLYRLMPGIGYREN
jgi:hypothetical protein